MNLLVKHNGTTVTSYVISYERETKICTGIGELSITFSATYPTSVAPWDTIDIWENGSFQVKYYVSSITKSKPDNTIVLECQDKSKRLVDYFIPDKYTIDYPSYTRYWIEKFLTEAGITYLFSTTSQGVLLSNYTVLGLMPGYEQVMNLLQLSGWYMFFDGNGVAKIGSLQTLLTNVKQTFTKTSILEISVDYDDKMLRNRAVVWGAYDFLRNEYAYADISTHTRWNYDRRDYRTMVVSNQNIPNKSSAFGIANTLLKEFSRITIEKHLSIAGASNRDLGDMVRVRSNIWNGTGMITTYGVSMSKNGLTTNLILDERCPRLFGFFDFGDEVYVGTYGDGIWRKHIKYDPTWRNFSTGITNLAITDLHINNEVYGAVASSGEMYYTTTEEGPWVQYSIDSLSSSLESQIEGASGIFSSGIVLTTFSGLHARATIVDRITNVLKYGIDTYSGVNYGDYFMMYSGFTAGSGLGSYSGFMAGEGLSYSGYRGWIVEFNPFTTVSGVYPISVSGNFNIMVVDLENDGLNDYVSVRAGGGVIPNGVTAYDYGAYTSQPFSSVREPSTYSVTPENIQFVEENTLGYENFLQGIDGINSLAVYDNEMSGIIEVISIKKEPGLRKFQRTKITRTVIEANKTTDTSRNTVTSAAAGIGGGQAGLVRISTDIYRAYWYETNSSTGAFVIKYRDWDAALNSLGNIITLSTTNMEIYSDVLSFLLTQVCVINSTAYICALYQVCPTNDSTPDNQTYLEMYTFAIDMMAGTSTSDHVLEVLFPQDPTSGTYHFIPNGSPTELGASIGEDQPGSTAFGGLMNFLIVPNGLDVPRIIGWFCTHHHRRVDGINLPFVCSANEYLLTGSVNTVNVGEIYSNIVTEAIAERQWNILSELAYGHLTGNRGAIAWDCDTHTGNGHFAWNGSTLLFSETDPLPEHLKYDNIFPILNDGSNYISKVSGTFYLSDASGMTLGTAITGPPGYTLFKPFSCPLHSYDSHIYFLCDNAEFISVLVPFSNGIFSTSREIDPVTMSVTDSRGINIGSFFISAPSSYSTPTVNANVTYIDMLKPYDNPGKYLVLQRDGMDFSIIQQSDKPIRVDISNSSPVMTVLDLESSFKSQFIYGNELQTVSVAHSFTPLPSGVRDYRYTIMDIPSGIEIASGIFGELGADKLLLYLVGSGVNYSHVNTLTSGFVQMWPIPSGLAERIEVSNFVASGQYIFVTTSGDNPDFYQKDPMLDYFTSYSGLPDSRATIIRLDDRF